MSEYIIVTDSSADLTQELVEELDVSVLPLSFTIRGTSLEDHPDKRNMSSKEFYQLLRDGEMATTNAVNVSQYEELLTPFLPVLYNGGRGAAGKVSRAENRGGGYPLRLGGSGDVGLVCRKEAAGRGKPGGCPGLVRGQQNEGLPLGDGE